MATRAPNNDDTVVFLREENGTQFIPLIHRGSLTLRQLAEDHNISSVLECDENGVVQHCAVVFNCPEDVLSRGKHYIVRRDVQPITDRARRDERSMGMGSSRVTFHSRVIVKEFSQSLPPQVARAPDAAHGVYDGALGSLDRYSPRSKPQARDLPLDGGSSRKRSRYGMLPVPPENSTENTSMEPQERAASLPQESLWASSTPALHLSDAELTNARVMYLPFTDVASDGTEQLVTLDMLRTLCQDVDGQEKELQRKHEATQRLLEETW